MQRTARERITTIDADYTRPQMAAIHLLESDGRAAFIDSGTNSSVPAALATLESHGLARDCVDYVILTHVHLDHAGGAGRLMRELPNATLLVHPRGASHIVEPAKLVAGTRAVYGEDLYDALYGELLPIDEQRVRSLTDGERVTLGNAELESWHTPGHALHHQAIVDHAGHVIFAGDTFGLSYRELDTTRGAFIMPTTTPTQFDPQQLITSVQRIAAYEPNAVYLTHYSRVTDIQRLASELVNHIQAYIAIAQRHRNAAHLADAIEADLRSFSIERVRAHGCSLAEGELDRLLGPDLMLNAQGLAAWLARLKKD